MTNTNIENYKKFNTKKKKQNYIKGTIAHFLCLYKSHKEILNQGDDIQKKLSANQNIWIIYNLLLLNSILKNDDKNIKENFNNLKLHNLETMTLFEELSDIDNITFKSHVNTISLGGEEYLNSCNNAKIEYDLYIYIIKDYNKIELN